MQISDPPLFLGFGFPTPPQPQTPSTPMGCPITPWHPPSDGSEQPKKLRFFHSKENKNRSSDYNFSPFGAELLRATQLPETRISRHKFFCCILFDCVICSDFCTKWAEILAITPVFCSLLNEKNRTFPACSVQPPLAGCYEVIGHSGP
jgi:hypothetical protein